MDHLPVSFVGLILRMTGIEAHRSSLAAYFDGYFETASSTSHVNDLQQHTVQAKSIALVEDFRLAGPLKNALTLRETQNLLSFAKEGEINVLVVREQSAPHSQHWSLVIASNFSLIVSNQAPWVIKVQARYDRAQDQLTDLSIDKNEFDFEAYQDVLSRYTVYHTALNPSPPKK
jgi:hypothetical protein